MQRAAIAFFALILSGATLDAQTASPRPALLFFTADWCAACAALKPKLQTALAAPAPPAARIDLDVTTPSRWALGLEAAENANASAIVADYAGKTGFAVLVSPRTGKALGCINASFDADAIAFAIARAQGRMDRGQDGTSASDVLCPKPNRPAPGG